MSELIVGLKYRLPLASIATSYQTTPMGLKTRFEAEFHVQLSSCYL